MYIPVYLHEHISKAIDVCNDEIERRLEWAKNEDWNSEQEKQASFNDYIKFMEIKTELKKLYEKAKTIETY